MDLMLSQKLMATTGALLSGVVVMNMLKLGKVAMLFCSSCFLPAFDGRSR